MSENSAGEERASNFIRAIIEEDLARGTHGGQVVTRFPPEPNGYLHIGHAKSICLNFGLAQDYQGVCNLRMDDTNPKAEDIEYVHAITRDIRWLGFEWGENMFYASDYYGKLYDWAVFLIKKGLAYVCDLGEDELRAGRGTLSEAGTPSPGRERSVEENLDLFARMKAGEFEEGAYILRARIDMASPNMKMRDPILYRILHAHHYRQGDAWCIYPMYDWAHPLEDALEGITHSICTLEFENNRELYDWVLEACEIEKPPRQYEFARLNLDYTVMSKRYLLKLVKEGFVEGWDDPRMPTVAGMRRRGYTPEAIRAFCDMIGVAKNNSIVDLGKLEYCVRDDLNHKAPRVLVVQRPLKVTLTNWGEGEVHWLDGDLWPHDVPREATRKVPFTRELYIDREDFNEQPPKGYRRLSPGGEVRLRHGWVIRCDEVIHGEDGEVSELRCSYLPESLGASYKVNGTIQWVSASHGVPCEVRLYDRLFTARIPGSGERSYEDDLNLESLVKVQAVVEPFLKDAAPGERFQFERQGYFIVDEKDSAQGAPVFNRIVTLRDSWSARRQAEMEAEAEEPTVAKRSEKARTRPPKKTQAEVRASIREQNPALAAKMERYTSELGLEEGDADVLTGDEALADFFEAALEAHGSPSLVANWVTNEVLREIKDGALADLKFGGAALGELVALVDSKVISATAGKEVFSEMVASGQSPEAIVEARGLRQVSDADKLGAAIDEVLAQSPAEVERYRGGARNLVGFFMGKVMRATGGTANPKVVQDLLRQKLG